MPGRTSGLYKKPVPIGSILKQLGEETNGKLEIEN